jgi:hypothetical protein
MHIQDIQDIIKPNLRHSQGKSPSSQKANGIGDSAAVEHVFSNSKKIDAVICHDSGRILQLTCLIISVMCLSLQKLATSQQSRPFEAVPSRSCKPDRSDQADWTSSHHKNTPKGFAKRCGR